MAFDDGKLDINSNLIGFLKWVNKQNHALKLLLKTCKYNNKFCKNHKWYPNDGGEKIALKNSRCCLKIKLKRT